MFPILNPLTSLVFFCAFLNPMFSVQSHIELKLKQVNVLFRHGDRTPDTVYPGIPYTEDDYFPTGIGGLTNNGKLRAFRLGEILRQKYNDFLGSTYLSKDVETLSSDFERTKMSLQLVLAGLYPPNSQQKWKADLNWQPIPIKYVYPVTKDYIFRRFETCQNYLDVESKIMKLPEVTQKFVSFDHLIKKMSNETKTNLTDIADLRILYCNLVSLKAMGFKVPEWAHNSYIQNGLLNATMISFDLMSYNKEIQRINGGAFIRKFIENMLNVRNKTTKDNPKLHLYSGHDMNILALYSSLNLGKSYLSEFTSAIILELHQLNHTYYVKIWHYLGIPSEMKEIQIPNCSVLCPLDCFINQTKSVIPSDEEFQCTGISS